MIIKMKEKYEMGYYLNGAAHRSGVAAYKNN